MSNILHCGCSANGPETSKAMLRMENEIKRARAKNGRAVLILIVEGTPANYVTFLIQSVSKFCTTYHKSLQKVLALQEFHFHEV